MTIERFFITNRSICPRHSYTFHFANLHFIVRTAHQYLIGTLGINRQISTIDRNSATIANNIE